MFSPAQYADALYRQADASGHVKPSELAKRIFGRETLRACEPKDVPHGPWAGPIGGDHWVFCIPDGTTGPWLQRIVADLLAALVIDQLGHVANAYFWELRDLVADELIARDPVTTTYREMGVILAPGGEA
jgi:hypothetical protein